MNITKDLLNTQNPLSWKISRKLYKKLEAETFNIVEAKHLNIEYILIIINFLHSLLIDILKSY